MKATGKKSFAVVILAAGQGKRMGNPTIPKVLHRLNGKTLIDYVLTTATALQPEKLVVVVGYQREKLIEYLRQHYPTNIHIVIQEKQQGTGDAVLHTLPVFSHYDGTIVVLNGDVPLIQPQTIERLLAEHWASEATLTVMTTVMEDPTGYGRIIRDANGTFLGIVEEADANELQRQICEVNTGVIACEAKDLFPALQLLTNQNAQGEYYLTDIVGIVQRDGKKAIAVPCAHPLEAYGVNKPEHLQYLEKYLNNLQGALR